MTTILSDDGGRDEGGRRMTDAEGGALIFVFAAATGGAFWWQGWNPFFGGMAGFLGWGLLFAFVDKYGGDE